MSRREKRVGSVTAAVIVLATVPVTSGAVVGAVLGHRYTHDDGYPGAGLYAALVWFLLALVLWSVPLVIWNLGLAPRTVLRAMVPLEVVLLTALTAALVVR